MRWNTTGWLILVALLAIFCSQGTASAMSAFSRKYKMQCDGCHTSRLPELNAFGIEFYKNGFALSKQDDATKAGGGQGTAGAPDAAGGKEKVPSVKAAEPKTAAKTGDGEVSDAGEEEEPPPKPEPPPTVVYRSKSRDGTVFFTDTPERRKDFFWKQDDGEEEPTAPRAERTVQPKMRKTAAGRQQAERQGGGTGGVKVVGRERFRNYEECMERQLIGAKQPESGQEMMDLMMAAEKRCAGYPLQKR